MFHLIRFPITGGWSLFIVSHIHIYHRPALALNRRSRYGITFVR